MSSHYCDTYAWPTVCGETWTFLRRHFPLTCIATWWVFFFTVEQSDSRCATGLEEKPEHSFVTHRNCSPNGTDSFISQASRGVRGKTLTMFSTNITRINHSELNFSITQWNTTGRRGTTRYGTVRSGVRKTGEAKSGISRYLFESRLPSASVPNITGEQRHREAGKENDQNIETLKYYRVFFFKHQQAPFRTGDAFSKLFAQSALPTCVWAKQLLSPPKLTPILTTLLGMSLFHQNTGNNCHTVSHNTLTSKTLTTGSILLHWLYWKICKKNESQIAEYPYFIFLYPLRLYKKKIQKLRGCIMIIKKPRQQHV